MKNPPSFITPEEFDELLKKDRFISRKITKISFDEEDRKSNISWYLFDYLKIKLKSLDKLSNKLFKSIIIRVENDDGMSWSAELINFSLRKEYFDRNFNFWCFPNEPKFDELPKILDFVGIKRFLKIAKKFKLTKSYNNIFSLNYFLTLTILLLVGTIYSIIQALVNKTTLINTKFFIISCLSVILSLIFQYFLKIVLDKTIPKCLEEFKENIREKQNTVLYQKFIETIANEITGIDFPRFVIIDNYESLDPTTKRVIERYFNKYSENAIGTEIWIIFEGIEGELFSKNILFHKNSYGYLNSEVFIQENLDEEERKRLAAIVGHPERADFKVVKKICKGYVDDSIEKFFKSYRESHPKNNERYGDLEFLFLISLNSLPTISYSLNDKILISEFSRKKESKGSKLRDHISREFLYGTRNKQEEIASRIRELHNKFDKYILRKNETFIISKEVTEALINISPQLKLPSYKLGHLFWAHFWYDKLEKHITEPFWIRKLTFHLLESDINKIKDEQNFRKLIYVHFNALIFAINRSIKSGLFQYIEKLIEKAYYLLQDENFKNNFSFYKNLYRECWKAYAILGNDKIMEIITQLSSTINRNQKSLKPKFSLDNLFFETIILPYPLRNILIPNILLSYKYGNIDILHSISDFAKIKSIWLSYSLSQFVSILHKNSILYKSFLESKKVMEYFFDEVFNRITEKQNPIKIIDVITLSLAMWLNSYRTDSNINLVYYALQEKGNLNIYYFNLFGSFHYSIDKAKDLILLASELKKEGDGELEISNGKNFPLGALSRELCVVAISSVFISGKHLLQFIQNIEGGLEHKQLQNEITSSINQILDDASFVLEVKLGNLSKLMDLLSEERIRMLDNLLNSIAIIWREFNIKNLEEFLNLRRIIFKAIFMDKFNGDIAKYHRLIETIGEPLSEYSYMGILSNICFANILKKYGELKSHYLRQAALLVLNKNFGINLKNELSLIAIEESYVYGVKLTPFIKQIVSGNNIEETFLYKYLTCSKDDNKILPVIWILISNNYYSEKELQKLVKSIIQYVLNKHYFNKNIEEECISYFKYLELEESIKSHNNIDCEKIYDEWKNKKSLWLYPAVLLKLIESNCVFPTIVEESIKILEHDPSEENSNTYFFLAKSLLERYISDSFIEKNKLVIPLEYIKKSIELISNILTIETRIETYSILFNLDNNNTNYYLDRIRELQSIKLERDHLKELPKLIAQNKYFSILFDYIYTFQYWGLLTDIPQNEFYSKINTSIENKKRYLDELKIESMNIPNPLLYLDGLKKLNSEFFVIGKYLLDITSIDDELYKDVLQKFNDISKTYLDEILNMILKLPELPKSIKELLFLHKKKFDEYTLPIEN